MDNLIKDIYSKSSDGSFYPLFSLSVDDMEHLILINFERDPELHNKSVGRSKIRSEIYPTAIVN